MWEVSSAASWTMSASAFTGRGGSRAPPKDGAAESVATAQHQ